jgi:glutathione S-transferase
MTKLLGVLDATDDVALMRGGKMLSETRTIAELFRIRTDHPPTIPRHPKGRGRRLVVRFDALSRSSHDQHAAFAARHAKNAADGAPSFRVGRVSEKTNSICPPDKLVPSPRHVCRARAFILA